MTVTETHPMHEVRSILWTLLISATASSVAANIAHALVTHGLTFAAIGPVLFAMLAPAALLGLFHLMAAWARAAGGRRWVFWFYLLSVVVLAGAAFRLSFAAIRDLALGYGYSYVDAALFPLILDGLIAVCTVGLVAATRLRTEPRVRADDAPVERLAETAEQVPPAAVGPTERSVEQADPSCSTTEQQPWSTSVVQAGVHPLTSDDTDTEPLGVQAVERPVEQVAATALVPVEQQLERPAVQYEVHRPTTEQPLHEPVEQSITDDVERPAEHRAVAEQLVERGPFSQPVELVEQVLVLKAAGRSYRQIAEATGIGATTVGRIHKAADEVTTEPVPVP